jgi:hypothetical protein
VLGGAAFGGKAVVVRNFIATARHRYGLLEFTGSNSTFKIQVID